MVTKWGLSDELGPLAYSEDEDEVFLGRSVTQRKNVSEVTAQRIDAEIKRVIDEAYTTAKNILIEKDAQLHLMADALMKYETIDAGQIDEIMEGREPGPPSDWWDQTPPDDGDDRPQGRKVDSDKKGDGPIGGPARQH